MSKHVTVKTSAGSYYYKISKDGKYYCYKLRSSGSEDYIGSAHSLEDAISLIKADAGQYGSVYGVSID